MDEWLKNCQLNGVLMGTSVDCRQMKVEFAPMTYAN